MKDEEWTYVPQNNAIRFEPNQVPPSQTVIVAEYEVLDASAGREVERHERGYDRD